MPGATSLLNLNTKSIYSRPDNVLLLSEIIASVCSLPDFEETSDSQVKWDVMKRKEVPKKVNAIPTAPLVLIWEMILVVTVACSTSVRVNRTNDEVSSGAIFKKKMFMFDLI